MNVYEDHIPTWQTIFGTAVLKRFREFIESPLGIDAGFNSLMLPCFDRFLSKTLCYLNTSGLDTKRLSHDVAFAIDIRQELSSIRMCRYSKTAMIKRFQDMLYCLHKQSRSKVKNFMDILAYPGEGLAFEIDISEELKKNRVVEICLKDKLLGTLTNRWKDGQVIKSNGKTYDSFVPVYFPACLYAPSKTYTSDSFLANRWLTLQFWLQNKERATHEAPITSLTLTRFQLVSKYGIRDVCDVAQKKIKDKVSGEYRMSKHKSGGDAEYNTRCVIPAINNLGLFHTEKGIEVVQGQEVIRVVAPDTSLFHPSIFKKYGYVPMEGEYVEGALDNLTGVAWGSTDGDEDEDREEE